MSLNTLVSLTNGGGTILLFLAIAWLVLSFVLLKIIFFPGKKYLQRAEKKKSQRKGSAGSLPAENVTDAKNSGEKVVSDQGNDQPETSEVAVETETVTNDLDTKPLQDKDQTDKPSISKAHTLARALEDFSPEPPLECNKKSDAFWTYTAEDSDALEVGTAFADELQRLGYEIQSDTHETASATRSETLLTLHIEQQEKDVAINVTLEEPNLSALA